MAANKSLGVHTPVALSYLIEEGILPPDATRDQYKWDTYTTRAGEDSLQEEILTTRTTVVWSQGKFLGTVYRFDQDGEDVVQALLTTFPTPATSDPGLATPRPNGRSKSNVATDSSSRALVILLKTKAYIHFLQGSSHIVDLPFEVERAFAAPRGLLLQRKRTPQKSLPPTPQVPLAPPNSFFSSQGRLSTSLRQSLSPTLARSFAKTSFRNSKRYQPSALGGDSKLDLLFQEVIAAPGRSSDEDVTNLYSLSDPLSDLGVVTYSLQHHKPRISNRSRSGLNVDFEGLHPAEQIIYVSHKDELSRSQVYSFDSLTLLATFNPDINTITIWHAWYIKEKSLRVLLKRHAEQKEAKTRRRSSFLSANLGTGAATPGIRRRDGTRESFAAPGVLAGDVAALPGTTMSRKPTRQQEEEAMASQMDPDYQLAGSQQPLRENRRISSMNADVRASQTTVTASFGGTGGRRATSFGGTHSRRSLSLRKSRGSTPGSAYAHSVGEEDQSMDLESTIDFDSDESVEDVLRHIRATFEVSGTENVFGNADEDFKREIVVKKIHSFPVGLCASTRACSPRFDSDFSVATLSEPSALNTAGDAKLKVFVHEQSSGEVHFVTLRIKYPPLWPELTASSTIAIPLLLEEGTTQRCEGVIKLSDGGLEALLFGSQGVQFSPDDQALCQVPTATHYRVYEAPQLLPQSEKLNRDIGKNRLLEPPPSILALEHAGLHASFDEVTQDGVRHRRRLLLRPLDPTIDEILMVCEFVLPKQEGGMIRKSWCTMFAWLQDHPETLAATASSQEFVALAATIFVLTTGLLDSKARAALNISKVAARKPKPTISSASIVRKGRHNSYILQSSAWSWIPQDVTVSSKRSPTGDERLKDQLLVVASALAQDLSEAITKDSASSPSRAMTSAAKVMLALHIYREEQKLSTFSPTSKIHMWLAPVIAQLGSWLGLDKWGNRLGQYYYLEGVSEAEWAFVNSQCRDPPTLNLLEQPVGVFQWFEHTLKRSSAERYPSLALVAEIGNIIPFRVNDEISRRLTPRTSALSDLLAATSALITTPSKTVELLLEHQITIEFLETLPESIAAPFREALARCERKPPTTWSGELLRLVGRNDLNTDDQDGYPLLPRPQINLNGFSRDVQAACHAIDHATVQSKTKEAGRHAISQLIFNEDRRLVEATSLMHFNSVQVAQCPRQPDWTDQAHFEHQRKLMQWVTIRMIALPAGDGMIHYDSQTPLLTEKYHLPGFNSSCLMQPMGHTLTTDRTGLTEEKVNWAYFHAGVSAGLRISHHMQGIDTSWIAFNKPNELTNRNAGLLLALGLGGHLRQMAKWLSFKYLTPKHTMTSVGLLLGLSASYIGTMDSLVTRMLSVHITKMLPPGAAELNVSPATQTAGLMGIGLLYYNTQHRRMSEIMLSEIEYMEMEDPDNGPDMLRDESYRLAAGFAVGLINLGKGNNLQGLRGMQLAERLLAVAVGPRPVNAVHVFDRATAGAVVAVALVYMKSGDSTIARKIDIPDTEAQYDQVRPDVLMLRAMAKHIILWDDIRAKGVYNGTPGWIHDNLPKCYKKRSQHVLSHMMLKRTIDSAHIPLFNVFTGLAWALGLKYAGSGNEAARDEILEILKFFQSLSAGADAYYFDAKLGRASLRRCMDVLALCAAVVMAGTGDLETFRYLRRMHGRVDQDTTYGSHFAAHLAVGTLFLGGGTFTFGTSDLAVAALMCAFYPLFPTDVHDNRVHLQAFRHLWVLAVEARCIVVEDIDTHRPIHMPIKIMLRDGSTKNLRAPCLLPELDTIAAVQTDDPGFWRVTLDFASNPAHLASFRKDQRVFVRRCPATEAHGTVFSAALAALNDAQNIQAPTSWASLLNLPAFKALTRADVELVLPPDVHSSVYTDERGTVIDDRLVLSRALQNSKRDQLWNLRMLFAWAERAKGEHGDGQRHGGMTWIGNEAVEQLKAGIEGRASAAVGG